MQGIRGLLFDKDGTLFDFQKTWGLWARDFIHVMASNGADPEYLADLIDFDLPGAKFKAESIAIAGTMAEIAEALHPGLSDMSVEVIEQQGNKAASDVGLVEAIPLKPYLTTLKSSGFRLGVSTNDAEASAKAHLESVGILDMFDFIAGYDSGFGSKPEPGMQLAFCEAMSLRPSEVVMIGDSNHDLIAGNAAGMPTIGVLTGVANEKALKLRADVVLEHIGLIPAILNSTDGDPAT